MHSMRPAPPTIETKGQIKSPDPSSKGKSSSKGSAHGAGLEGNPSAAVAELHRQHPHKPASLGPHHNTSSHKRHIPLGGLKPR